MYTNDRNCAMHRRLNKQVLKSKLLHPLDNTSGLILTGTSPDSPPLENAKMEISNTQTFEGKNTLKVTYPLIFSPVPTNEERAYGCTRVRLDLEREDISEFNRISFWVYPEKNEFDCFLAWLEIKNEGEKAFPNNSFLSGCHTMPVIAGKWNQFIWEIPDIPRDAISMIQFNLVADGIQQNMRPISAAFFSSLELQQVEPDKYMGWDTADKIAFCHSGYAPNDEKKAVTSLPFEKEFSVIESGNNTTVFSGEPLKINDDTGEYYILDFSALQKEGEFYLKYGETKTPAFKIEKNHLDNLIDKLRNFFYMERCGCEIEGIHHPCHLNCFIEHNGKELTVAGGWHDAADLSQGLCNTSEAVHSMLNLSTSLKLRNPALSKKIADEARIGLDWMLNTRFDDGFRCTWNTSGRWMSGAKAAPDTVIKPAQRTAFDGLCAVAAEAESYIFFNDTERELAKRCLDCAEEDFLFALEDMQCLVDRLGSCNIYKIQLYAQASFAASALYKATKKEEYLTKAVLFADYVLSCQQTSPTDWDVPFIGFFHETNEKKNSLNYDHRGHEQAIISCIAELLKLAPSHEKASAWKNSLELYREFILKLSSFDKPYGRLPTGVYYTSTPSSITGTADQGKALFAGGDYIEQVKNGIKLNEGVYLRRMPVVAKFRGCFGVQLSRAKAISTLALSLGDKKLLQIAKEQIAFILGKNPFCRSFVFGEGYDYPYMSSPFGSFDVVGEIPVGMNSFENTDIPYMPATTQATYFEVWVHPASRLLWTIADIENFNK